MTALAPLYIKKAYKDEPSFRDAKVVFSVYEDDFKGTFNNDFASKLMLKGINKKDVATLKDPVRLCYTLQISCRLLGRNSTE